MHLETEKSKLEYLEDLIHDSKWFPNNIDDRGFIILCDLMDIRNGNIISEYEMHQRFELACDVLSKQRHPKNLRKK